MYILIILFLLFESFLTFLTKQFAITYTNRENGQINKIKTNIANLTP